MAGETGHGVPIRVYGSPDNLAHSSDQLDDVIKAMDFFEDYLG